MGNDDMKPEVPAGWVAERREWHLDKTVSVGHLISTLVIGISVFSWAIALDKRVEQNSIQIQLVKEQQRLEATRVEALRIELRGDLRDINQKLDRIIEDHLVRKDGPNGR